MRDFKSGHLGRFLTFHIKQMTGLDVNKNALQRHE